MSRAARKLKVGVTGANSDLGRLLIPRLAADPRVGELVVFDVAKPEGVKATFRRVDLTKVGRDADVSHAFEQEQPEVVYHLAFAGTRVHRADIAHELEVMGSMHVLTAAARAKPERLVVASMTAVYGARAQAPAVLTEDDALHGCPGSRFINDKVEVERQFSAFRDANPRIETVVLRFAPLVGPTSDNPVTRWLRTGVIPTLMGYDPLWQAIHENDAAEALQRALVCPAGVYNVAADGVMPLSGLIRQAGSRGVPLPGPVLRTVVSALESVGRTSVPDALLDYLRYSLVADVSRAPAALGFLPRYSMAEALSSLQEARA
ncbi:MAG: NAD-dependent epimerase/dehydratase family protein [Myxococcaceae bacterium]|nr:NAD-dependent epimerase/dehydratase family protein [Myxococcaceae bacterium]